MATSAISGDERRSTPRSCCLGIWLRGLQGEAAMRLESRKPTLVPHAALHAVGQQNRRLKARNAQLERARCICGGTTELIVKGVAMSDRLLELAKKTNRYSVCDCGRGIFEVFDGR